MHNHPKKLGKMLFSPHISPMTDNALHLPLPGHRRSRLINRLHTWLLAGGQPALLIVCAWTLGGASRHHICLRFGGISLYAIRRISPQMVLTMYKARPVTRAEFPQGLAIVEELARRASLPKPPKLHVIPSRMMNAFAVGRRDDSVVAVTDQLIRALTARELTGVLAHEISHIHNEDLKVMALADTVSRFTSLMSTVGIVSLLFNITWMASGSAAQVPWLGVIVLLVCADHRRIAADGAVAHPGIRCGPRCRNADRRSRWSRQCADETGEGAGQDLGKPHPSRRTHSRSLNSPYAPADGSPRGAAARVKRSMRYGGSWRYI